MNLFERQRLSEEQKRNVENKAEEQNRAEVRQGNQKLFENMIEKFPEVPGKNLNFKKTGKNDKNRKNQQKIK